MVCGSWSFFCWVQIATTRRLTVHFNPPSSCVLEINMRGVKIAVKSDDTKDPSKVSLTASEALLPALSTHPWSFHSSGPHYLISCRSRLASVVEREQCFWPWVHTWMVCSLPVDITMELKACLLSSNHLCSFTKSFCYYFKQASEDLYSKALLSSFSA